MKNKLILFVLMTMLSACSAAMQKNAPDIGLVNLNIEKVTLFESDLRVRLRASNLTADKLNYKGATVRLYLNDEYVGKGGVKGPISFDSLEDKELSGLIHLSNISLFSEIQPLIESGKFEYRLEVSFIPEFGFSNTKSETEGGFTFPESKVRR